MLAALLFTKPQYGSAMTSGPVHHQTPAIDYESAIGLDAEDLAEQGIAGAYQGVAPAMGAFGVTPELITETIDDATGGYSVSCAGEDYCISGPGIDDAHAWGLATWALFEMVNRQLITVESKMFAISGGHDLAGIFMTPADAEIARRTLPKNQTWPYLPTSEPEWFGMLHD